MAQARRSAKRTSISHLTGARFLLSLWIVNNHFVPKQPETALNHVVSRSNVAVSFFICMSGFITHWAYGSREMWRKWQIYQYCVRRIGRVVVTTWFAMVAAIVIMALTGSPTGHVRDVGHVCRCFMFIETWLHPMAWCPNGQTWTVAALIPSWLLYPWTRRIVGWAEMRGGGRGLFLLAAGAWLLEFGPIFFTYIAQDFRLSAEQHHLTYFWPPSQLVDFFIGATVAALAKYHSNAAQKADEANGINTDCSHELRLRSRGALLSDIGAAAILLLCCAIPNDGSYRTGFEVLYNHGVIPAISCFLFASPLCTPTPSHLPTPPRCSYVALLLRQQAFVGLGTYSFQVYLFQWPVHMAISNLYGTTEAAEVFVTFCLVLWICAGLYAEHIEAPFIMWLRDFTSGWEMHGGPEKGGTDEESGEGMKVVIQTQLPPSLTQIYHTDAPLAREPKAHTPLLNQKRSPLAAAANYG